MCVLHDVCGYFCVGISIFRCLNVCCVLCVRESENARTVYLLHLWTGAPMESKVNKGTLSVSDLQWEWSVYLGPAKFELREPKLFQ